MRVSRLGVVFCLIYLVPTIVCVVTALASGDPKSRFVLLQLPIGRQMRLLHWMGFNSESFYGLSWPVLYLLLGTPIVVVLYCIGLGVRKLITHATPTP